VAICAPRGITAVIPEPSNQVGLAAGAVHEGPPTRTWRRGLREPQCRGTRLQHRKI